MFITKSESPVVVVLSGSMEPAFQRGDILFLNNQHDPIRVGEVVVFKIKDRDIPIVHRVLKVHEKPDGRVELLTKGDNNRVDDRGLYAPGQQFIGREDILGRAVGTLRYVGMVGAASHLLPPRTDRLCGMRPQTVARVVILAWLPPGGVCEVTHSRLVAHTCRSVGRRQVTIILNDYPALKYVLVAVMGRSSGAPPLPPA